jgi:hypothetical protein
MSKTTKAFTPVLLAMFASAITVADNNKQQETTSVDTIKIESTALKSTEIENKPPNTKKQKDVTFKPSEAISEDLSVPFPTDI